MPKFTVYCTITQDYQIEVEADSKENAKSLVEMYRFSYIYTEGQLDDDRLEITDVHAHDSE